MKILILDDDQTRHTQFKKNNIGLVMTHVETAKDCIFQLENCGPWDVAFLDHDLGGQVYVTSGKETGYEVAEYLRDNPSKNPKETFVHSLNPVGARNMANIIPGRVRLFPFAWTKRIIV